MFQKDKSPKWIKQSPNLYLVIPRIELKGSCGAVSQDKCPEPKVSTTQQALGSIK